MKRAIFSVLAAVVLAGLTGCVSQQGRSCAFMPNGCTQTPGACQSCDSGGQVCNDQGNNCGDPGRSGFFRGCSGRFFQPCRDKCREEKNREKNVYVESGPPAATVTYPYYTIRGPRDFLARNPGNIGP
jgi:hypothetical protein